MDACGVLLLLPFALLALGYILGGRSRTEVSWRIMKVGFVLLLLIAAGIFFLIGWFKSW